jgi:hypothetical protein
VDTLDDEARAILLQVDPDTGLRLFDRQKCLSCSGVHDIQPCPRIRRRVFAWDHDKQLLIEEEFWPWAEWPHDEVIFETDLFDDQDV